MERSRKLKDDQATMRRENQVGLREEAIKKNYFDKFVDFIKIRNIEHRDVPQGDIPEGKCWSNALRKYWLWFVIFGTRPTLLMSKVISNF
jgi:hypothetical protein